MAAVSAAAPRVRRWCRDGGVGATAVVAVLPPVRLRGSAVTIAAELGRPLYNAWTGSVHIEVKS